MPNGAFDAVQHWRRHAHQLREGLLRRVEELSVSDYPEATAHQVIKFLIAFLGELTNRIGKSSDEKELRFVCQLIETMGVFLEWLDNANTSQTPRALAQLLKSLMDRLEPQSGVVAVPQAKYNYSIRNLGDIFQQLVAMWVPKSRQPEFEQFTKNPIKAVSFPRIERDNVMIHAIFGHELGHPIATEFLNQEQKDPTHQAAQTEIQKKVAALVQSAIAAGGTKPADELRLKTHLFDTILQVRLRAIEELVSDFVGYELFGPSAVFATYDVLWTGDWDVSPASEDWYPPSRQRLRLLVQQLDAEKALDQFAAAADARAQKYGAVAVTFIDHLRALIKIDTDQAKLKADPVLAIAYEWMEKSLPGAFAFARDRVKDLRFDVGAALAQMPELLHRLELGIPPNEIGDPLTAKVVDFRSALLAAWLFKIQGLNKAGEPLTSEDFAKLNLQCLLAIEYVILRSQYQSHLDANLLPA